MLETFSAACQRDTTRLEEHLLLQHAWQQHQQQQQRQLAGKMKQRPPPGSLTATKAHPAVCARIQIYLCLLPGLADICGGDHFSGPLAPHMELCVRLSWAVLRCEEASNGSSSNPPGSTAGDYARAALDFAAQSALDVAGSVAKQLTDNFVRTREFPQLADAAASNALYHLLLVKLALCAQVLQESSAAKASGQQVLPQRHHRLLLQELGVEWLEHSHLHKHAAATLADIAAASVTLRHHT
jgi:hypothetical protein